MSADTCHISSPANTPKGASIEIECSGNKLAQCDGVRTCSIVELQHLLVNEWQLFVEAESIPCWRTAVAGNQLYSPFEDELCGINSEERRLSRWAGRVAARKALMGYHPKADLLRAHIVNNEFGKPEFAHFPEYCVSIAHSFELAVACVGNEPAGIDLEYIQQRPAALQRYFFSTEEQDWIDEHGGNAMLALHVLWTRKEAVSKYVGMGGRLGFKGIAVLKNDGPYRIKSFLVDNYVISLCRGAKEQGT